MLFAFLAVTCQRIDIIPVIRPTRIKPLLRLSRLCNLGFIFLPVWISNVGVDRVVVLPICKSDITATIANRLLPNVYRGVISSPVVLDGFGEYIRVGVCTCFYRKVRFT